MANEVKLEVYTFRIKPVNTEKSIENYLPLEDIGGNDFFDVFQEYLAELDVLDIHDNLKKAIKLEENSLKIASRNRRIRGNFESGGYGIESNIYSLEDSHHIVTKGKGDVEIMPFYFLIYIPKDTKVGILIVQRLGIYGISTILKSSLYTYVRKNHPNYVIEFNPLVSKELAQNFVEKGSIKEIILRKYALPEDAAEVLTMEEYTENILSVELRIKSKGVFAGMTGRINKYLADPNGKFFDIPELRKIGFEDGYKISVVSEFDGSTRTLDLSDTMQIRPYYDIDQDVKKLESGHPIFESIDKESIELLLSLLNPQDND